MRLRPITLTEAREGVALWHSHHKPHLQHRLAVGAFVDGAMVAVCVWEHPKARMLASGGWCWELSRLACGPVAPRFTASRLVGATTKAVLAIGITRCISYTRADERGTCYRAANWHPAALVPAEDWSRRRMSSPSSGWLPGLYAPSTERVDRVRWERGPDAAAADWKLVA